MSLRLAPATVAPPRRRGGRRPEPLEPRVLFAVSYDPNGYTVVTPSADSRVIYVNSVTGSDANPGLSTAAPLATIAKAETLVRSGMPDEILLARGEVFHGNFLWTASGRSATEPALIGAYGTGARPLVDSGTAPAGFQTPDAYTTPVNYLDVIGVAFEPLDRDPTSAGYKAGSAGGTTGFRFYAPGGNVLVEDCSFQYFINNIDVEVAGNGSTTGNITIRRSISSNSYSTNSHSQGLYANGIYDLLVTQCVFDHDGWNTSVGGAGQQGYNHDIYCSYDTTGVSIQGNVLADASFSGVMARSGGDIDDNLFVNDPDAVVFGDANGADSTPGGVVGSLLGNAVVGTASFQGTPWGQGFEIGNTKPGAGLLVSGNVFTADAQKSMPAILLTMATATLTPAVAVGENDVTIQDNVFNGGTYTVQIDGRFVPGGTGLYGFTDVHIDDNDILNGKNDLVRDDGAIDPTQLGFAGNRYYDPGLAQIYWAKLQMVNIGIAPWLAAYDTTGTILTAPLPYADPTRSVATYDAGVSTTDGGTGTVADFVANAKAMSPANYQPQYTAAAVIAYVDAGYQPDTTPPTATAATTPVDTALLGGTAYTFTVAYADDSLLNAATIKTGDVLVTGPNGFSATPTLASATATTPLPNGGQQVVATYTFAPPGGAWAAGQDGTYTVSAVKGTVADAAGNAAVAGTIGTFAVDLTPPTATVAAPNIGPASLGGTSGTITVTYADASGINVASLTSQQVVVTAPNGTQQYAVLAGTATSADGLSVVATYTIVPPDGAWSSADNGTYAVALAAGSPVLDDAGNAAATGAALATFTVAVGGLTPLPAAAGSIAGFVYVDANANGAYDPREVPLAGVTVFLDLAGTGRYAAGDPTATTAADGSYAFAGLSAGTYAVFAVTPAGYQPTSAAAQSVAVTAGGAVSNVDFGEQVAASVTSANPPPPRPRPTTPVAVPRPIVIARPIVVGPIRAAPIVGGRPTPIRIGSLALSSAR